MTISACSKRPANCCAVKLRWNAAPALSISERESSPLWLPLNTGKSFCQGQRAAGEPTCCTRLKSLSQWVSRSIGRQCRILSSLRAAASSAAEATSWAAPAKYESANGQVTVTSQHSALPLCHGTTVRPSGRFPSVRNNPVGSLVTGKPAEAKPKAHDVLLSCRGFLADKALNAAIVAVNFIRLFSTMKIHRWKRSMWLEKYLCLGLTKKLCIFIQTAENGKKKFRG